MQDYESFNFFKYLSTSDVTLIANIKVRNKIETLFLQVNGHHQTWNINKIKVSVTQIIYYVLKIIPFKYNTYETI